MPQIVIAGAGECGTRAAFALRESGFSGSITLLGAEAGYPYERPPLSKQFLLERAPDGNEQVAYTGSATQFAAADIQYLPAHRVSALHPAQHQISVVDEATAAPQTRRLDYDKLLLATGSSPRLLPVPGVADNPACCYLRTLADARQIHQRLQQTKHLLVIGGGLIGLELAATARQRGVAVTVLEAAPQILGRGMPRLFADALAARHQQAGVQLRCGVQLARVTSNITPSAQQITAHLENGELIIADLLVIGIGASPNQTLAAQAGLQVANGIVVNEYLQTSHPDIFAAGDCCSFPSPLDARPLRLETWRNAQSQGNLVARNLQGQQQAYTDIPWFWSDQYELGLQVAGFSDAQHHTVQRRLPMGLLQFELADSGQLMAAAGLGSGNSVAKDIRLAEMLISRRAMPDPAQLADPGFNLKQL